MRSGAIRPEVQTRDLDRRTVSYALWEQAGGISPDLPWTPAASFSEDETAQILSGASTAALVIGRGKEAGALLQSSLAHVARSCRLYCYASSIWEADGLFKSKLGALSERVLVRLGLDAPADWLVVDGGRAALLLLGPTSGERRWLLNVDGPLARSLYEAFRVLFWFHSTRECLPDVRGTYAFRTPLAAPFAHPGNDIMLPAGRLLTAGTLTEVTEEAEIRVVPDGSAAGPSRVNFIPPDPKSFVTPLHLVQRASRVIWTDLGLPKTYVSRQRLVMDLSETPISLQLEWPKQAAIDLFHRLTKVAQKPAWQFHPERRLADVAGQVLLEHSNGPEGVQDKAVVEVPSVVVPPEDFDNAQPARFPEPPPLARVVTYRWTVQPTTPPPGAREAELVRRWRTVDEWARVRVDTLRQALEGMERDERGFLDRLLAWLPRNKEHRQRRDVIRANLDELGEAPPSQQPAEAKEIVQRLLQVGKDVRLAIEELHTDRQQAESAAAEQEQRAAWEERMRQTKGELAVKRLELAKLEDKRSDEDKILAEAQQMLAQEEAILRALHKDDLVTKQGGLAVELAEAREAVAKLPPDADKQRRKECARQLKLLEQQDEQMGKELANVESWTPPASELVKERRVVRERLAALTEVREKTRACSREIEGLEKIISAPFVFEPPPGRPKSPSPAESHAPTVPNEAPPELGELLENRGTRYLAVRTWEQVQPASQVAKRLQAELVFSQHNPR